MAVAERYIYSQRQDLERYLPHRDDALYLERIEIGDDIFVEPVGRCRAMATLDTAHRPQWFAGHFEGKPVLPGHHMIEFAAQVSAFTAISADQHVCTAPPVSANVTTLPKRGRTICLFQGCQAQFLDTVSPGEVVVAGLVDWIRERKRALFDVRLCVDRRIIALFEIEGAILSTSR